MVFTERSPHAPEPGAEPTSVRVLVSEQLVAWIGRFCQGITLTAEHVRLLRLLFDGDQLPFL
jgi:hypothetical protein